jgi:LacI family transcriptional regulator
MSATIKDVAEKAQVGVGTVSRVLNNSPSVSSSTREKVQQAIKELNYSPNPNARRLSLGKTWHIAVVLPYLTFPSYVERLRGVQHVLADSEYDLVLYSIGNPDQRDEYFSRLSKKSQVDGLLIISLPPTDRQAELFVQNNIATVLVDACHDLLSHVIVDDIKGGHLATQHLISLGHRKIAFLSDTLDTPYQRSAEDRFIGYRQTLKQHAIPVHDRYIKTGKMGRRNAYLMTKDLLKQDDPPTALFAASDTQAIGALDAAKTLNIPVPDQLSVIGYDGIRDAEYLNLTTIAQPLFNSGVIGTKILIKSIQSRNNSPQEHLLPLQLVDRKTTAPPYLSG